MRNALLIMFPFVAVIFLWPAPPEDPLPADPIQRCMVRRERARAPSSDYIYTVGMRTIDELACTRR
jgi:hypothetical protein